MNKLVVAAALCMGVGLGCAAATVAAPFVIPPARAGNVTQWEYACAAVEGYEMPQQTAALNQFGSRGFELAGAMAYGGYFYYCFKRPR